MCECVCAWRWVSAGEKKRYDISEIEKTTLLVFVRPDRWLIHTNTHTLRTSWFPRGFRRTCLYVGVCSLSFFTLGELAVYRGAATKENRHRAVSAEESVKCLPDVRVKHLREYVDEIRDVSRRRYSRLSQRATPGDPSPPQTITLFTRFQNEKSESIPFSRSLRTKHSA